MRRELASLWKRILQIDRSALFGIAVEKFQDRSWGDRIAQPGYVGPDYEPGGLASISMNPGGGRGVGLGAEDLLQYDALIGLRDCEEEEIEARFESLTDVLRKIMPTWTIIQAFEDPILEQASIPFSSIAYFNLLKWRTASSAKLNPLYDISWRDHTGQQKALLNPSVVIAVGVDAGNAFRRHHAGAPHLDVIPRVIGNRIGEPGREAIRRIYAWIDQNPVGKRSAEAS